MTNISLATIQADVLSLLLHSSDGLSSNCIFPATREKTLEVFHSLSLSRRMDNSEMFGVPYTRNVLNDCWYDWRHLFLSKQF